MKTISQWRHQQLLIISITYSYKLESVISTFSRVSDSWRKVMCSRSDFRLASSSRHFSSNDRYNSHTHAHTHIYSRQMHAYTVYHNSNVRFQAKQWLHLRMFKYYRLSKCKKIRNESNWVDSFTNTKYQTIANTRPMSNLLCNFLFFLIWSPLSKNAPVRNFVETEFLIASCCT